MYMNQSFPDHDCLFLRSDIRNYQGLSFGRNTDRKVP
jgi:hypothetical protein